MNVTSHDTSIIAVAFVVIAKCLSCDYVICDVH